MKQLFAIVALMLMADQAGAQISSGGSFSGNGTPFYTDLDTLTDDETVTYTQGIAGHRNSITFQLNMKDITGDPSGVIATLQVSADAGTTYKTLYTDTMANANTVFQHVIEGGNPWTHYKWVITGAGTHSSSYQAWVNVR